MIELGSNDERASKAFTYYSCSAFEAICVVI